MSDQLLSQKSMLLNVCDRILEVDNSIRFSGFANNNGKIIAAQYRNGLDPLLTSEESELSFIDSVLRMRTRDDMKTKLGKVIYSSTVYEKVNRATILLDNEEYPILMVSFDNNTTIGKGGDHESIIVYGILSLVSYYAERSEVGRRHNR